MTDITCQKCFVVEADVQNEEGDYLCHNCDMGGTPETKILENIIDNVKAGNLRFENFDGDIDTPDFNMTLEVVIGREWDPDL